MASKIPITDDEVLRRIRQRYVVLPSECWIWTRGRGFGSRGGEQYGACTRRNRVQPAHRVHWELVYGDLPDGVVLDHLCRETLCINLRHLDPVSDAENLARGFSPSAECGRKRTCDRGHAFVWNSNGRRECPKCRIHARRLRKFLTTGVEPYQYVGHAYTKAGPSEYRCKCGLWLSNKSAAASQAQRRHLSQLWAAEMAEFGVGRRHEAVRAPIGHDPVDRDLAVHITEMRAAA